MAKITASTQEVISIDTIEGDALILKSGSLRKVLLVSGISFDLKSEEEQNALLGSYQDFLNSLDFSLQEIIHSRKLNIAGYLETLEEAHSAESSHLLKNIITDYKEFIENFVSKNPIMDKTFFIVVPYDPIQIPKAGRAAARKIFSLLKKQPKAIEAPIGESLKQLNLRVDQVIDGLNRIGIRGVPLGGKELEELFYNFYNPAAVEKSRVKTNE